MYLALGQNALRSSVLTPGRESETGVNPTMMGLVHLSLRRPYTTAVLGLLIGGNQKLFQLVPGFLRPLAVSSPGERRARDARSHFFWPRLVRKEYEEVAWTSAAPCPLDLLLAVIVMARAAHRPP
jgi:hypothetical protein